MGLGVNDVQRTAEFYKTVAGFRPVSKYQLDQDSPLRKALAAGNQPIEVAMIAGPNGYIECASSKTPTRNVVEQTPGINGLGIRHFCIQNKDCDILAKSVRRGHGSLIADPLDLGTGNQYAYARDPERNIIEIEGLPYAPSSQPTWIGHVALVTRDLNRIIEFYRNVIGSELQGRAMVGPSPQSDTMGALKDAQLEGAWLPAGNMLLELWQFHAPLSPPKEAETTLLDQGYTHICLETDDLDQDMDRMCRAGANPMSEPIETYNVRIQFVRDPDGNIVELLEPQIGFSRTIASLPDTEICSRTDALK